MDPSSLSHPPPGLATTATPDAITVHLHPFLVERGRHDVGRLLAVFAVSGGLLRGIGGIVWSGVPVGLLLAVVGFALGIAWVVTSSLREGERHGRELDVRIGRDDLRLTWSSGGKVTEEERVFLREVGRVDVREAGYQRPHVVARLVGRELVIPAERESNEAATWLADRLAAAGRSARERDGAGQSEIPSALSALRREGEAR